MKKKVEVIFLSGLPASGKSTYAKKLMADNPGKYKRVNKDLMREMLDNSVWSKTNEEFILVLRDSIIRGLLVAGISVIVDDTNLHDKHLTRIKELIAEVKTINTNVKIEIIEKSFTDVPLKEVIIRDAKRDKPVGEKVIRDMYNKFLKVNYPVKKKDKSLPDAIIVDIDGTLARMTNRNPFEWSKVSDDELEESVADVVKQYWKQKVIVFILSGRDGSCRKETTEWLTKHKIRYTSLFMREAGNNESDVIVKERIYNEEIKDRYNVLFVLDDRDKVVHLWRSLGLKCFQVAEGDF